MPAMSTPHDLVNPPTLAPAVGFSHAVASRGGRTLWLAGQNGTDGDGRIVSPGDLVAQLDLALANLVAALSGAGGRPEHLVQVRLYVTDVGAYRASRHELGAVWRRHCGRHFPAMTLLGVSAFFDPEAVVEIDGVAVVPDPGQVAAG